MYICICECMFTFQYKIAFMSRFLLTDGSDYLGCFTEVLFCSNAKQRFCWNIELVYNSLAKMGFRVRITDNIWFRYRSGRCAGR
jgi:hypothetical protein